MIKFISFFVVVVLLSSCTHRYTDAEKRAMTYRSPVTGSVYDQTVFDRLPIYVMVDIERECESFQITDPCVQRIFDRYLVEGLEKRIAGVEAKELDNAKAQVKYYGGDIKYGINPNSSVCLEGNNSSECGEASRDLRSCVGISKHAYKIFASPQRIPATLTMYNGCPDVVKIFWRTNIQNESFALKPGESRRIKYEVTNPIENSKESVSVISAN